VSNNLNINSSLERNCWLLQGAFDSRLSSSETWAVQSGLTRQRGQDTKGEGRIENEQGKKIWRWKRETQGEKGRIENEQGKKIWR
jgi:hypothetical protein